MSMTVWMLYVILATGQSGPMFVPREACDLAAVTAAKGQLIPMDMEDGSVNFVVAAACLGPVEVDPCEMEPAA